MTSAFLLDFRDDAISFYTVRSRSTYFAQAARVRLGRGEMFRLASLEGRPGGATFATHAGIVDLLAP